MVELITLSQDVFSALRTLIIANKPTYVFDGTTYTYTLIAAQPNNDSVFPCVVLDDSDITDSRITLDAATGEQEIEVKLDFYALYMHGKKAIAAGRDGLRNTFIGNIASFITDKLIPKEDFWTDTSGASMDIGNQKVNTASSTVRYKLG